MFAQSHREPLAVRPSSFTSHPRAALWGARAASLLVALGIVVASVLAGNQVVLGQNPIGGTSGLFALYAATAGVGVGLALFHQLRALTARLAQSLTPPAAKVIALPQPASVAGEERLKSRPINAA
jgi:hypothetical protein